MTHCIKRLRSRSFQSGSIWIENSISRSLQSEQSRYGDGSFGLVSEFVFIRCVLLTKLEPVLYSTISFRMETNMTCFFFFQIFVPSSTKIQTIWINYIR